MRNLFLLTILILVVGSCGMIERQALMRDKYPYYPQHIKQAIDGKYLVEGMDMEQVYLAIGPTFCTSSSYYKGNRANVWAYSPNPFTGKPSGGTYDCLRAVQRVYFQDGVVVGWDNMPF